MPLSPRKPATPRPAATRRPPRRQSAGIPAEKGLARKLAEREAELARRTAELAVIASIQQGMAAGLGFQAIIDLVGDEVRKVFSGQNTFIALYNQKTGRVRFPYWVNHFGERTIAEERELGGLTGIVIQTRQPLVIGSAQEADAHGAYLVEDGRAEPESWLGVPILVGDAVIGVITVQDYPKDRYSQSDAGFDHPGAIRMHLEPVAVVAFLDGSRRPLSEFAGQEVVAAAAIGNPERFFSMLRAHGLVVETRTLPDHARFTPALAGVGGGKPVLLTEKDAVKCNGVGWSEGSYVEVAPVVESAAAADLLEAIAKRVANRQGTKP